MPQVVPVSDFRSDIKSVSRYTDEGEVVILTQNGRPRWTMIDYDEWNETARAQERAFARAIRQTEDAEENGSLRILSAEEFREQRMARKEARRQSSII